MGPRRTPPNDDEELARKADIASATQRQDEKLEVLKAQVDRLEAQFAKLDLKFEQYVTSQLFKAYLRPIEWIAYGAAGSMLLALFGALISLVVRKQ